jgi:hypothetical protein
LKITVNAKKKVLNKYQGRCSYCGCKSKKLTLDHIKPVCEGGTYGLYNLTPACYDCNHCRGRLTLHEFKVLIRARLDPLNRKGLNRHWKAILNRFNLPVTFYYEVCTGKNQLSDKFFWLKPKYVSMAGWGFGNTN